MPYAIRKLPKQELYKVYNRETKAVHSNATSLENAKKQVRLLHMMDAKKNKIIGGKMQPPPNNIERKMSQIRRQSDRRQEEQDEQRRILEQIQEEQRQRRSIHNIYRLFQQIVQIYNDTANEVEYGNVEQITNFYNDNIAPLRAEPNGLGQNADFLLGDINQFVDDYVYMTGRQFNLPATAEEYFQQREQFSPGENYLIHLMNTEELYETDSAYTPSAPTPSIPSSLSTPNPPRGINTDLQNRTDLANQMRSFLTEDATLENMLGRRPREDESEEDQPPTQRPRGSGIKMYLPHIKHTYIKPF